MAFTAGRINKVVDFIESSTKRVQDAKNLFTINEGELLPFVLDALRSELDDLAYTRASKRVSPINVLPKMVNKLSTLYVKDVIREIEKDTAETNQEVVDFYVKEMDMDPTMICSQKQFNVNKYTALEPYLDRNSDEEFDVPKLRVLPAHTFLVYSDDIIDPTNPTVFIKILGNYDKETNEFDLNKQRIYKTVTVYMLYDKENIIAIDSDREIRKEFMTGNEDGINPFGKIPFIYISNNKFTLLPLTDTDRFAMSVLIPLLLTDLNYATQFMSHSIIYAIDADISNLSNNPDAMWHIKSEVKEDGETSKASIGTIKPEVDIDKVLKLIETELRMWLDTENIKGASIGNLEVEQAASGIAKMIDESDTTEAREEQESLYQRVEREFWQLMGIMHNTWLENGDKLAENRRVIDKLKVNTSFQEQRIIVDEEKRLREITMKLDNKLTSRRRALLEANQHLNEGEINKLMEEIKQDELDMFNVIQESTDEDGETTIDVAEDFMPENTEKQ